MIGFGGYPTLPPLIAARLMGVPTLIHDSNAVLGRANRFLAGRVDAIATSLPGVFDRDPALASKATLTGTPLRPAVLAAAAQAIAPEPTVRCVCWWSAAARARASWPISFRPRSSGSSRRCGGGWCWCSRCATKT